MYDIIRQRNFLISRNHKEFLQLLLRVITGTKIQAEIKMIYSEDKDWVGKRHTHTLRT